METIVFSEEEHQGHRSKSVFIGSGKNIDDKTLHKRVAVYDRTERYPTDWKSDVEPRLDFLREWAERVPDSVYVGAYADYGLSANENRKGLKELIRACSRGEIDLIIVRSFDRLYRSIDALKDFIKKIEAYGADVFSAEDFAYGSWLDSGEFLSPESMMQLYRSAILEKAH